MAKTPNEQLPISHPDAVPPPAPAPAPPPAPPAPLAAPAPPPEVLAPYQPPAEVLEAGMVARQGFGTEEIERSGETSSTAGAAMAKAQVEARIIAAKKWPRDLMVVHSKLMHECRRPGFAAVARYSVERGKKKDPKTGQWVKNFIEGASIRFAEAAARCMTNLDVQTPTVFDGPPTGLRPGVRIIRATVSDLEANTHYTTEIVIEKTVERSSLPKGRRQFGQRTNGYGDPVFIVEALESDLVSKCAAEISKAIRTQIMRLVPGDIVDDCMELVLKTLLDKNTKDPDAERKALAGAFFELGVPADQIEEYLGHSIASTSPAELVRLRALYTGIRDGQTTWRDATRGEDAPPATPPASAQPGQTQAERQKADLMGSAKP